MTLYELRTLYERRIAEAERVGASAPVANVYRYVLDELGDIGEIASGGDGTTALQPTTSSWRERLWLAPEAMRIGVVELAEAVGRPKAWVYRHTSAKSGYAVLPHRKLDGALTFVVGEVRAWLHANEEIIAGPPPPVSPGPVRLVDARGMAPAPRQRVRAARRTS